MERPEPVSRVIPPRITCTINIKTPINNQFATAREEAGALRVVITGAKLRRGAQGTRIKVQGTRFKVQDSRYKAVILNL